jgi:hypothetical protein
MAQPIEIPSCLMALWSPQPFAKRRTRGFVLLNDARRLLAHAKAGSHPQCHIVLLG